MFRRALSYSLPAPWDTPSASQSSRISCKSASFDIVIFCCHKHHLVEIRYWSEWESRTIYRADKFTGQNETAITGSLVSSSNHLPRIRTQCKIISNLKMRFQGQLPMVIQIYHSQHQPQFPNHCQPFNGHCSHLCLPAPRWSSSSQASSSSRSPKR